MSDDKEYKRRDRHPDYPDGYPFDNKEEENMTDPDYGIDGPCG